MKWITLILAFNLSTNVWAGSDDETEEPSLEEVAAEAKALQLLGEDSESGTPEVGLGSEALLGSAPGELDANPQSTLPVEPDPPELEQTLEAPTSGRPAGPPVVRGLPPEKEQPKPPQAPALYQGLKWRDRYHSGRDLSKKGFKTGAVGGGMVVGGLALFLASWAKADSHPDLGMSVGLMSAATGGVAFWGGAGMSAWGASKSHSALARAGIVNRPCLGCVGAWATAIHPWTLPISYLSSFVQIEVDKEQYKGAVRDGPVSSTIRLAPVFGQTGAGLSVKGAL